MAAVEKRRLSLLLQDRKIEKKSLSYWQQIVQWYDNFMFDYFPPSQDFPPLLRQPIGFVFLAGTIVIFVSLFVIGFNQAKSKVFLAPSRSAEGICKPVPVANSGAFLGTEDGFWQGSRNFSFAKAAYVVTMNDLSITEDEYVDVFSGIEIAMHNIGAFAKVSDLAFNILLWSAFVLADESGSVTQRFYMTGEPMQILDREFIDVTIANPSQSCAASSNVRFDTNNARLRIDWNYESFTAPSSNCTDIMNPDIFGYNPFSSSGSFGMQIDMRTVMVGAAVNFGIVLVSTLTLLPDLREEIPFLAEGSPVPITFIIDRFVDPRYPGMSPLTCIVSPGPVTCVIIVGFVPTLPYFFHSGQSFDKPDACRCPELSAEELSDIFHPCHTFNFMAGLLFYNTEQPAPLFELYTSSNIDANRSEAFQATWFASSFGQASNATAEQRAAAFSFCASATYGNCSMLTISFYDMFRRSFTVSKHYYQLLRGACRNSFSGGNETWSRFRSTPYAPLVQRYVECKDTFFNVFTDQTGIAIGNAQLITPIFTVLLILIVMFLNRGYGFGEPETYTKNDKADAVDALAVAMLLTKEGLLQKGHADSEAGREGVVHMLVKDLEWHIEGDGDKRKGGSGVASLLSPGARKSAKVMDESRLKSAQQGELVKSSDSDSDSDNQIIV